MKIIYYYYPIEKILVRELILAEFVEGFENSRGFPRVFLVRK